MTDPKSQKTVTEQEVQYEDVSPDEIMREEFEEHARDQGSPTASDWSNKM